LFNKLSDYHSSQIQSPEALSKQMEASSYPLFNPVIHGKNLYHNRKENTGLSANNIFIFINVASN